MATFFYCTENFETNHVWTWFGYYSCKKMYFNGQAERGFAAAAVFVLFQGRLGFWQKKRFNAPRATDLREEMNCPQAKQYVCI